MSDEEEGVISEIGVHQHDIDELTDDSVDHNSEVEDSSFFICYGSMNRPFFQQKKFENVLSLINKMRVGVSLTIIVLTALAFSETLGQEISFDGGFECNETFGLSPTAYWSSEGTVTLTSADFIGFKPKVIVRAYYDLCTVDLTTCPPDHPVTSSQPCFCRSRVDDTYHIHVGSQISRSQVGGTLEAVVPGHGPLRNIFAAANIGTLPSATDNQQLVKASYILDNGTPRDLMYSQNVTVCSEKRVFLEICVNNNGHPAPVLTITVGKKTVIVKGDRCIAHIITPGQTKKLTYVYKEQEGCTQIHQMYFEENSQACVVPTADTVTSSAPTTTKEVTTMTLATTTAETPTSFQINGICPDTPRTVTTLPSGEQVLTDDVTYNGSWTVFQKCDCEPSDELHCPYCDVGTNFMGPIPCGLCVGRKIVIKGTTNADAKRFTIDLRTGLAPDSNISLIYDNRIQYGYWNTTVLNNMISGKGWQKEVRYTNSIGQGQDFTLEIAAIENGFAIAIGGIPQEEFNRPFEGATFIKVALDVNVKSICFN